jgi:hypothetical protein
LVFRFIGLLQLETTSKDYAVTVIHTSQITIGHTRPSQSITVFINSCLVAAANGGHSPSSGFRNVDRSQLPGSHRNSAQILNCSSPLSNSPDEVKFMLPQTVSRPFCLGAKHPSVVQDQIFCLTLSLRFMLRPTVSWPTCLGIKRPSGGYDQILLLSDSCRFVDVGRSL